MDVKIHAILAAETLFQKCSISSSLKASHITNFGLALLSFSFLPRIVWFGVWGVIFWGFECEIVWLFCNCCSRLDLLPLRILRPLCRDRHI